MNTIHRTGLPLLLAACCLALAGFNGCGTTAPESKPSAAADTSALVPRPATSIRIGSLDLTSRSGRIETEDVTGLAALISKMKIDVIAIQGLTRYPGVSTRTDLVDALAAATGMRTSFGETISVSGRQSGNAVLSAYPIASSDSRAYEGVSGNGFEGALQAIVDAGTRTVVVLSTRLPDPLSAGDRKTCTAALNAIAAEYPDDPLVVMGNLPAPPGGGTWSAGRGGPEGKAFTWFTPRGISVEDAGTAGCTLGTVRVAAVDIYPRGRP